MTTSFSITPVERGIVRCQHTGEFTPDETQSLAMFMLDYRGKLLIDLSGTTGEECSRHIKNFRPMMPTTAISKAIAVRGRSITLLPVQTIKIVNGPRLVKIARAKVLNRIRPKPAIK